MLRQTVASASCCVRNGYDGIPTSQFLSSFTYMKSVVKIHPFSRIVCAASFHSQTHIDNSLSSSSAEDPHNEALNQFDSMICKRPCPSTFEFNEFLTTLAKRRQFMTVVSMFARMDELGTQFIKLDLYTLNIAVNCFCRLNRVDLGFSALAKLLKLGYKPDLITYSTLINGLCLKGDTNGAISLLRKMEKTSGYDPTTATYTSIINSLCKQKKKKELEEASELFSEMLDKGIAANFVTFTPLIRGFCYLSRWDKARELLTEMIGLNLTPCVQTVNAIVQGYCLVARFGLARKVFDMAVAAGCSPDVTTFTILINAYCKSRTTIDEAVRLFMEMSAKGMVPETATYDTIIRALCKARKTDTALRIFEIMQTQRHSPIKFTYNIMFGSLCWNQQLQKALSFFDSLQSNGWVPNAVVFRILLQEMWKAGKLNIVPELLMDLSAFNVEPVCSRCSVGIGDANELLGNMEANG